MLYPEKATEKEISGPRLIVLLCVLYTFNENSKYKKLKSGSIPTIFPEYPSYKQPSNIKKRKNRNASSASSKVLRFFPQCIEAKSENVSTEIGIDPRDVGVQVNTIKICELEQEKKLNKNLRTKIYRLEKKVLELEKELQEARDELDNYPEKKSVNNIKKSAEEGDKMAIYILDQINNFQKLRPEWSEQTIRYCICWRISSPKGYEFGRNSKLIQAPSRSTLDRYVGSTECGVGVSPLIRQRLLAEAAKLNEIERIASLICDEMAIKERLLYNKEEDKFFGLVEAEGVYDEQIGINPILANKLLCFVINGLSTKYTIPAAYFMVRNLQGKDLLILVRQVIKAVEDCGFHVLRLVTDNHRTNTLCLRDSAAENFSHA